MRLIWPWPLLALAFTGLGLLLSSWPSLASLSFRLPWPWSSLIPSLALTFLSLSLPWLWISLP